MGHVFRFSFKLEKVIDSPDMAEVFFRPEEIMFTKNKEAPFHRRAIIYGTIPLTKI
jgi:hypothetical protein